VTIGQKAKIRSEGSPGTDLEHKLGIIYNDNGGGGIGDM